MSTRRAFTLVDVLAVVTFLMLVIAFILPMLNFNRRSASGLQRSTQMRGIHTAMVLYSQGNNTYYPGFDAQGNRLEDYSTEYRFQLMLDEKYFTGEYIISPAENKIALTKTGIKPTTENYSYALLNLCVLDSPRIAEWKDVSNPKAAVASDRAVALNDTGDIKSVHTNQSPDGGSEWRGSVAWNDNHVTFEATHILATQYGDQSTKVDNLFDTKLGSMGYSGDEIIIDSTSLHKPADE